MENNKIGKAITYLRKRSGYTQKDLADRIGISDKAVSKWERGLGLPDIVYLRKLAILLDTDTDSLLAGDVVHHDSGWRGILVLNDNSYNIGASTLIYDKPLVYYMLCYFLLVGIKEIAVICSKNDEDYLKNDLNLNKNLGIELSIYSDDISLAISKLKWHNGNIMMVYGRCLLYGVDQTRFFQKAMLDKEHFTMLVLPKKVEDVNSHVFIDKDKKVISSDSEDQLRTQYDFSDIPIVFFPGVMLEEIVKADNIRKYISEYAIEHDMYVQVLDRGFVEIEIDDWDSVQEASTFIKIIQNRCGMNVYCIEEVAWRRGFISLEQLQNYGEKYDNTDYGRYILDLCNRVKGH